MKRIIYRIFGVFVVFVLSMVILAKIYFTNVIKCQITDISISNILEYPGGKMTADKFLKNFYYDYGLDNDVEEDIRLEPEKYKLVNVECNIDNSSSFLGVYNIEIDGNFAPNLSKVMVGKIDGIQSDDSPLSIKLREQDNVKFAFIVKDDRSDEEILKDVQKSKFTLNGGYMKIDVASK